MEARKAGLCDDVASDGGSGFSDVDDETAAVTGGEAGVQSLDGPELDMEIERRPSRDILEHPAVSSSQSNSDTDEEVQSPQSPTIRQTTEESLRVALEIKGSPDGEPGAPAQKVVVRLRGDWSPLGTARFVELVEAGFYNGTRFHRVKKGELAQFGLPLDPTLYEQWKSRPLPDETAGKKVCNSRGTVAFCGKGQNNRNCQVFINIGYHRSLDVQGFAPFAEVVSGMDIIDELFSDYGELPPKGKGPDPDLIKERGLDYLKEFPKLSQIVSAEVVRDIGLKRKSSLKKLVDDDLQSPASPKRTSFADELDANVVGTRCSPPRSQSPAGSGLSAVKALKV
jgi:peptidyl-prolyl cis-trans isomerase A (cyclophilin A)